MSGEDQENVVDELILPGERWIIVERIEDWKNTFLIHLMLNLTCSFSWSKCSIHWSCKYILFQFIVYYGFDLQIIDLLIPCDGSL
ncbi:hypothetical protein L6452_12003 [Arctium lappa]|uniref:Uncharacterized protein n=1 Tax=Arctium lappa TaxID=4217 RepID=A0ACB9DPW3_ARCLA|nr:hypothetical protein L6452_12003 [Arctium lappa]